MPTTFVDPHEMAPESMKRRQYLKLAGAGLGVASLTGMAGCVGGEETSEGLTEVPLLWNEGSMSIPVVMAGEAENLWETEGIDLDFSVAGYGRYSQAISSGEAPLNNVNSAIYMNNQRDDGDMVLAGGMDKLINGAFVPEDSTIESPADFEDQVIGIPPRDSGTSMIMTSMIQEEYGYDLEEIAADVIETDPASLWNLMTEQEDIDAMFQFASFTVMGRAEGSPVRQIFDPNEWWLDQTGQDALITFWGASQEWLEDGNAETALATLRGWEAARDYTINNLEEVIESYGALAGFTDPAETDQVQAELADGAIPNIEEWDQDVAENQYEILDLLVEYDFYDSKPSVDEGAVTFSQLEEIAADD